MSAIPISIGAEPLVLHLRALRERMSDDELYELCQMHEDLRFELTSEGDLVIMPPTGGETGQRNASLTRLLGNWAEANGTGIVFDSSTLFTLPNGAKRSPDVAWVKRERWEVLRKEDRERFPPLCPDFIIELRSGSDRLSILQSKMGEYIANGAQLGWLIDPQERKVYVYRPDAAVECLDHPASVSGDPLLPGFILSLDKIWEQ
jgi:Uma2 family endonuclease